MESTPKGMSLPPHEQILFFLRARPILDGMCSPGSKQELANVFPFHFEKNWWTQKEITSQTDSYLVILSSKT